MTGMPSISVALMFVSWQFVLATSHEDFPLLLVPDKVAQEAKAILEQECGADCLKVLEELLVPDADNHNASASRFSVSFGSAMQALNNAVGKQASRARVIETNFLRDERQPSAADGMKLFSSDAACGSTVQCKIKQLAANRCNYARGALQLAYQSVNTMAHVLGVLVSLLCGCMYVEHAAMCVLAEAFPATCVFPYDVYSKIFAGSVQVWEAVKASTGLCMIHGDVSVSS